MGQLPILYLGFAWDFAVVMNKSTSIICTYKYIAYYVQP